MALFLLTLVFVDVRLVHLVHLRIVESVQAVIPRWQFAVMLGAMGFCTWRPARGLVDAATLLVWASLFTPVLSVFVLAAGRSPYPLADTRLAAIDHFLHISTPAIHNLIIQHVDAVILSNLIYRAFVPLILCSIVIPCLCGFPEASRRFVVGAALGILIGATLFTFIPAAGPWMTGTIQPAPIQKVMSDALLSLKSGVPVRLSLGQSAIVAFPSEHVVVATLAASALGSIRGLRTPIRILSALVCLSTLTTGWHYAADVIGGTVVASLCLYLADKLCSVFEATDPVNQNFGIDALRT